MRNRGFASTDVGVSLSTLLLKIGLWETLSAWRSALQQCLPCSGSGDDAERSAKRCAIWPRCDD